MSDNTQKVSICCGSPPEYEIVDDIGMCSGCKEGSGFITQKQFDYMYGIPERDINVIYGKDFRHE